MLLLCTAIDNQRREHKLLAKAHSQFEDLYSDNHTLNILADDGCIERISREIAECATAGAGHETWY